MYVSSHDELLQTESPALYNTYQCCYKLARLAPDVVLNTDFNY